MGKWLFRLNKRKCCICRKVLNLNENNFQKRSPGHYKLKLKNNLAGHYQYECKKCRVERLKKYIIYRKKIGKPFKVIESKVKKMKFKNKVNKDSSLKCFKCKIKNNNSSFFDIDHIIPISKNGTNKVNNLQLLCPNCHRMKTLMEGSQRGYK